MRGSGRQSLRAPSIALPIAAPVAMRTGAGTLGEDVGENLPVGPALGVFAIGRLVGVVGEMSQAEVVVLADLHPPKARDQRFGLVVGRPVRGPILALMIDSPRPIAPVQQVVGVVLVGRNRRPWGDEARCQGADVSV